MMTDKTQKASPAAVKLIRGGLGFQKVLRMKHPSPKMRQI
jgi:hypothetical protein